MGFVSIIASSISILKAIEFLGDFSFSITLLSTTKSKNLLLHPLISVIHED